MRTFFVLISVVLLISFSSCATRVHVRPAPVVVVKTLPAHYKIVRVHGKRYYYWDGNHYRKTRKGYVIVHF